MRAQRWKYHPSRHSQESRTGSQAGTEMRIAGLPSLNGLNNGVRHAPTDFLSGHSRLTPPDQSHRRHALLPAHVASLRTRQQRADCLLRIQGVQHADPACFVTFRGIPGTKAGPRGQRTCLEVNRDDVFGPTESA